MKYLITARRDGSILQWTAIDTIGAVCDAAQLLPRWEVGIEPLITEVYESARQAELEWLTWMEAPAYLPG